ncbi:MAG: MBOAT family protein, partial [Blautia sp.]|nr:MBOAT family protein [Blautia sp.]
MLFNSSQFICFFIVACLLYYLLPLQAKKGYLLLVSYVFYTFWDPRFLVFLGGITVLTYFGARIIEKNRKKGQLYLLIILTFLPLFFFKYYGFTITRMEKLLHAIGISADIRKPDLLLPIGISFFTFQAVGYLVDVWRGTVSAEKNILNYALFLSFFPQQASGPIGRAGQLLPQIRQPAHLNCLNMQKEASAEVSSVYDQVLTGVTYMLYGYFQKVVVADSLGAIVDSIYGAFRTHNSVTLLLASFLYSMQIYCDFAGYSNLALGAGKVLGFDLIQNFEAPYLASSVAEFWRRWHISLTTWFRDYLYIPLGGNRKGKIRQYFNILVVFLASGIW